MVHPMWGWHHGSLARSVNTMAVWPMTRGQNVVESIRHRAIDSWSENSWGPRPLAIWQHKQPHRKSQTNNNGTNANKSTQMQTNAKAAETARPKLTELTSTSTAKVRALCGKRLAIQVWHLHNLNHFQHQYISILDFTRQVFNTVNRPSICRCFHSASKAPMTTPLSIVSIQPRLSSRHARISSKISWSPSLALPERSLRSPKRRNIIGLHAEAWRLVCQKYLIQQEASRSVSRHPKFRN